MFELSYPTYEKVLESIRSLETELQKVYESHRDSIVTLSQNWYGATSVLQRNLMTQSLSQGSHYEAYRYTSAMRKIMEDYQLPIQQLMARREQLGQQLMQDEYVAPDLSCHTENDLIIEYSFIDILKGNCNMAMTYGNAAADVVNEMMTEALGIASEWLDFGDAPELLASGKRKINRLENYNTELTLFKSAMSSLEYDLIYEMYAIIRELGDTELEFTEFKPPIAEPKQMITSVEDRRFIEPDEVKRVLEMDSEEWTVDDAMYIAGAWSFYLEQQDKEMINAIVQGLFTFDYETYRTDMGIFPDIRKEYLVAEVDVEKIYMLLDNMDPIANSKAYQTLCNLSVIEPMRIEDGIMPEPIQAGDVEIIKPFNGISVSIRGLNKKEPYIKISFDAMTRKAGPAATANKKVKVYVYDLEDRYSEDVQDTLDTLDISSDEIETMLGEYGLNKTYEEYESMSDQDKANYDALAWLATMAMLPDDIPVPGTYTLPVGFGITVTYSVSVKGTISDGEVSATVEMQKKELKSITYSKDNADLTVKDDGEVSVNVKSEIEGLDTKVGGSVELGFEESTLGAYIDVGETITEFKIKKNSDNSSSFIYAVETKVSQNTSVSSELEIKKEETNNNLPGWKPVGIPIIENMPEPVRDLIENPGVLPFPMPSPVPVF